MKRAIIIVMDSVGFGELPDADKYGDVGSNTLGNIAEAIEGFKLENLQLLGLGNIDGAKGYLHSEAPLACFGKMAEMSAGKDTTTGHWEMSGIILERPFPVFPEGFPKIIIDEFEEAIKTKTIGNVVASGTEIIKTLGEQHVRTGYPIVYTSADSVFQVAAHEDIIPIEKLYEFCKIAREILKGKYSVGRVIARPFEGQSGSFVRTGRRHDFAINPIRKTVLDYIKENKMRVKAVGKIEDIFNKQGITDAVHINNNMDGVDKTIAYMKEDFEGLIFTNLVDFDMLFGHRNDVQGYAKALLEFDARIPEILQEMKEDDILIVTGDHGCDPTTPSTDHSREYVPILVYGKALKAGENLGIRGTFADIAATIADFLQIKTDLPGESFYSKIKK
jgi:phosphopentomutase